MRRYLGDSPPTRVIVVVHSSSFPILADYQRSMIYTLARCVSFLDVEVLTSSSTYVDDVICQSKIDLDLSGLACIVDERAVVSKNLRYYEGSVYIAESHFDTVRIEGHPQVPKVYFIDVVVFLFIDDDRSDLFKYFVDGLGLDWFVVVHVGLLWLVGVHRGTKSIVNDTEITLTTEVIP